MKVTITLDLNSKTLALLQTLLPGASEKAIAPPESEQRSFFELEQPDAQAATPALSNTDIADAAEPDDRAPVVTKTDIRAIALRLSKAGKQKDIAAVFSKFGCKKLSDFDNRPEDYPRLMKELVAVNG